MYTNTNPNASSTYVSRSTGRMSSALPRVTWFENMAFPTTNTNANATSKTFCTKTSSSFCPKKRSVSFKSTVLGSNWCFAGHRSEEAFSSPGYHQDHTGVLFRAQARWEHCSEISQPLHLFDGHWCGCTWSWAATCNGGNDSSRGKSTALVLLPVNEAYQVQASLDEKISGLDFNADTYEDSYNTFISFLNEIRAQKPLAYHRLMADLYKYASCAVIILIGQNMLTLGN